VPTGISTRYTTPVVTRVDEVELPHDAVTPVISKLSAAIVALSLLVIRLVLIRELLRSQLHQTWLFHLMQR